MPLPTITVNVRPPAPAPPQPFTVDDVVGVVGELGTGATATAGTLLVGDSVADFSTLGAGDTLDAITQLLNQVEVEVVVSPVATSATNTQVEAGIDLLATHNQPITLVMLTGDLAGTGATANANVDHLSDWVSEPGRLARAVVNADNTGTTQTARVAAAIAWAPNNVSERVMGVFNGPDGGYSLGAWLGGALRVAAERGRQWGIQMATVTGAGTLENNLTLGATDLTNLDNVNLSSLITLNGVTRIAGGSFNYASATEPQRDWSVARVVDHVEHIIRNEWLTRGMVGSTDAPSILAGQLQTAVGILVGSELVSVLVTAGASVGANRVFDVEMEIRTPAGSITANITLQLA